MQIGILEFDALYINNKFKNMEETSMKDKYNCNSKKMVHKKALTLVEVLVAIAIVAILFILVVSRLNFATDKANTAGVQTDFRSLQATLKSVAVEYGEFTDELETLAEQINKSADEGLKVVVENNELRTYGRDPWGTEYRLLCDKPDDTQGRVIITSASVDKNSIRRMILQRSLHMK